MPSAARLTVLALLLLAVVTPFVSSLSTSDCDCIGIQSITFQYDHNKNDQDHEQVRIVLYGQAHPSEVNHIDHGELVEIHGTYGPNGLLGPSDVKVHVFGQYGQKEEFESHVFKVLKCGEPKVGEHYGSLFVQKVVRKWRSDKCALDPVSEVNRQHVPREKVALTTAAHEAPRDAPSPPPSSPPPPPDYNLPCDLKLAVVLDVSGSITSESLGGNPDNEALLEGMIKSEIVDHLSGKSVEIAIYSFATNAYENIHYTSVQQLAGVQLVKEAIDDIAFTDQPPFWYTNWEEALTLVRTRRPSSHDPDVVLVITDGNPTVHIGSPYVPNDFGDDLVAGIDAANQLKANGNTRIIAIGVGTNVTVTNLQAISGPQVNSDYFVTNDFSEVQSVLHDLFHVVCCAEDKDECGVCFGDGSSCSGCDGYGGEYDVCGVCKGDGSSCEIPTCTHEVNVTVREETWFDIVAHPKEKVFEFIYHTNYIPNSGVVLGFDSYQECLPRRRGSCDNRPTSRPPGTYEPPNAPDVPFCDLFNVTYPPIAPYQRWKREVDTYNLTVWYKANFTLDELLDCRAADGSGGLIHLVEEDDDHVPHHQPYPPPSRGSIHYKGILYGSVIKLPHDVDCPFIPHSQHHHDGGYAPSPEPCEKAVISTHYNFDIWIRTSGDLYAQIMVSPLEIVPKWLGNTWLQSGDVIVRFSTRIKHIDQASYGQQTTKLTDAIVIAEHETGPVPFHVIETHVECEAGADDKDHYCEQIWEIRTYGATGVMDFSGLKPVRFTVLVNGWERVTAVVNLHLTIKRHSDPIVDNQLGAWIGVYEDRQFHRPYLGDGGDSHYLSFIDCEPVYVKVGLHQHTYNFNIDKVVICSGQHGDPTPYDPNYPESSGCNTPHIDAVHYVLFDRHYPDQHEQVKGFNFTFVSDPPSDPWERGFCFHARVLYGKKQLIQVHWSVDPLAHSLSPHLTEKNGVMTMAVEDGVLPFAGSQDPNYVKRAKELHRVLNAQRTRYDTYRFNYPAATYMKPTGVQMTRKYPGVFTTHVDQETHRGFREHYNHEPHPLIGGEVHAMSRWGEDEYDDDDSYGPYDYYYYHNDPVTSVNQQCYSVRCPEGYSYYRQTCVHSTAYAYYGYTSGISWWWFFFIAILLFFCLCVNFSCIRGDEDHHHATTTTTTIHAVGGGAVAASGAHRLHPAACAPPPSQQQCHPVGYRPPAATTLVVQETHHHHGHHGGHHHHHAAAAAVPGYGGLYDSKQA